MCFIFADGSITLRNPPQHSRLKQRTLHLVLRGALCAGTLFAFTSCERILHREISAQVLALEGAARGTLLGKELPLREHDFVHPGEVIHCTGNGRVAMALVPGILVELSGETEIEIVQLRLARDGDESIRPMTLRAATIRLRRGTLVVSLDEAQTDPQLRIETPVGAVLAGPADTFDVVVADDRAEVLAVRGEPSFRSAKDTKEVPVPAGYIATFPGAPQAPPQPAAAAGAIVQARVVRLLQDEKRLRHLESTRMADFVPWK